MYGTTYAHQSHVSNGCCLCSAQLGRKIGRTGEGSRLSKFTKSILEYLSKYSINI